MITSQSLVLGGCITNIAIFASYFYNAQDRFLFMLDPSTSYPWYQIKHTVNLRLCLLLSDRTMWIGSNLRKADRVSADTLVDARKIVSDASPSIPTLANRPSVVWGDRISVDCRISSQVEPLQQNVNFKNTQVNQYSLGQPRFERYPRLFWGLRCFPDPSQPVGNPVYVGVHSDASHLVPRGFHRQVSHFGANAYVSKKYELRSKRLDFVFCF